MRLVKSAGEKANSVLKTPLYRFADPISTIYLIVIYMFNSVA